MANIITTFDKLIHKQEVEPTQNPTLSHIRCLLPGDILKSVVRSQADTGVCNRQNHKKRRATWCTTVNVCHDEVSIGVDGTLLRMTSRDVERIDKDEEMMSVALPLR